MNINIFSNAIKWLKTFFTSGKAEAALQQAAQLAVKAQPIVLAIEQAVPKTNRTVNGVISAYTKFGVPFTSQLTTDPAGLRHALLDLGTAILSQELGPEASAIATNVLETAVQLAVTAMKAQ